MPKAKMFFSIGGSAKTKIKNKAILLFSCLVTAVIKMPAKRINNQKLLAVNAEITIKNQILRHRLNSIAEMAGKVSFLQNAKPMLERSTITMSDLILMGM